MKRPRFTFGRRNEKVFTSLEYIRAVLFYIASQRRDRGGAL